MPHRASVHSQEPSMATSYHDALERIRAEYLEMPGMTLRAQQVQRLCGLERSLCARVLEDLVDTEFLRVTSDGVYSR